MFLRITFLVVLAVSLVACNRDNFSAQRNADGGLDITVTATEAEVNTMLAMGTDIQGSLVFGMASFTQIEWRQADRPADSCLIDIGRELNIMPVILD